MASNFTTDQLKKMLQENQDKLDSLDSSDIVASKELKKSIDKISKLLLRTEKGILKELKESNKKSKKDKEETKEEIKSQFEDSRKDFKNRFSEFAQKNKLSMSSIRESYIENINEISEDYKKNLKRAFSDLKVNMSNDILENQKVIEQYLNNFASFITEKTTRAFNIAFNFLKTNMINAFGKIKGLVTSLGDKLGSVIKGTWDRLKGAISHPIESIKNIISNSLSYVWQGIKAVGTLVKNVFVFVLKKIWEGLKWVAGAIWSVVKGVFKAIWTVVSWIGKSIFFMFKWISTFLLKVIWGSLVKITSFLLSAIWEGIKAVGSFLVSVMWGTIKAIAKTVFQIAFTIVKSIATMVVSLITSALAPWLGLIALVGAGVYLLGYWMGWWGNKGNATTSKAGINVQGTEIKQGGFFETISGWIKKALGIGESFAIWLYDTIIWAWDGLWETIKKTWGITTDFGGWLIDQLKDFWAWVTGNPNSRELKEIESLEAEIRKIININSAAPLSHLNESGQFELSIEEIEDIQKKTARIEEIKNKKNMFGYIVDAIKDWWSNYALPTIIESYNIISNAVGKFIHGDGGWSSPTANSLLGMVYTAVFGTNTMNWSSPSYDSLLGQIYNMVFGKNSIDFKSSLGLVGFIYTTVYDINFFIIDSIEKYILPVFNSIMDFLSDIIGIISPTQAENASKLAGAVKTNISNRVSEAKGFQLTNTKDKINELTESIEYPSTGESKEHFFKRKQETEKLIEALQSKVGVTEKSNKEKKEAEKSFAEAVKKTTRILSGMQIAYSALSGSPLNKPQIRELARPPRNFWLARGIETEFVNNEYDAYGDLAMMLNYKDKGYYTNYEKELQKVFNKNNPMWKKYIDKDLLNKLNIMSSSIAENRSGIGDFLDSIYNERVQSNASSFSGSIFGRGPGWEKKEAQKYLDENLDKYFTRAIVRNPMSYLVPKTKDSLKQYGLARGGIVKPQSQGVNIIAAEAGSPEVILPLNRQGLTFIDEISKRLDYTSEHKEDMVNDIVTKLSKVIKDTVKSDKKETYATSSKQPVFLEDKSENSQLTKMISMGLLEAR